jgi:hypothetical protein
MRTFWECGASGARKLLEGRGGRRRDVTRRSDRRGGGRRERRPPLLLSPSFQPLNSLEAGVRSGPTNPLASPLSSKAQGPT